jgi:hypothetical protein
MQPCVLPQLPGPRAPAWSRETAPAAGSLPIDRLTRSPTPGRCCPPEQLATPCLSGPE